METTTQIGLTRDPNYQIKVSTGDGIYVHVKLPESYNGAEYLVTKNEAIDLARALLDVATAHRGV